MQKGGIIFCCGLADIVTGTVLRKERVTTVISKNMKKYCLVNQIKPERLDDYVNAHLNPWDELLECLKAAGTNEEYIFMLGNKALVFIECEDMGMYMEKFGRSEVGKKWLEFVADFIEESPFADTTGKARDDVDGLRKVFDLNQQLAGGFQEN